MAGFILPEIGCSKFLNCDILKDNLMEHHNLLAEGGKEMTIEAMERFAVLARHKSFSKAAEELYLSQSTLSRQIMELEKELECTLILRSGKGIVLSDAGRLFNRYAINALNENARFRVELSRLNICDDHRARIGYTTRGHHGILQQGIQRFPQNIHEYHFLQANPPQIAAMLNEGVVIFLSFAISVILKYFFKMKSLLHQYSLDLCVTQRCI